MKMKYNQELSQVVIEQIDNFEKAHRVIDEVEKTILTKIGDTVKARLQELELIKESDFDFYENDEVTFYLKRWVIDGEKAIKFHIYGNDAEDDLGFRWLSTICGRMNSENCLKLQLDIDYRSLKYAAREFKSKLKESFLKSNLAAYGFTLSPTCYEVEIPFSLDLHRVKECYPNDLGEAMEPIHKVLDNFIECLDEFDILIKSMMGKSS